MSRFLKVIVNIILVGAILTAAALLVPPLARVQTFVMDDMSMQTNLAPGSVTYAVDKEAGELKNGDKVLEQASSGSYVYRVTNLNVQEDTCTLTAPNTSPQLTKEANISNGVAKVVFTIPVIGYVVMAMKTTEGLIIIGLAVLFVILLFILSEVWKKDEDDEDDDEDEEEDEEAESLEEDGRRRMTEEEDEDEDGEDLSRKEKKRKKKEAKAARKAEKKEKKRKKKTDFEEEIQEEDLIPEETPEEIPAAVPENTDMKSVEEELAAMVRQFEQEAAQGNGSAWAAEEEVSGATVDLSQVMTGKEEGSENPPEETKETDPPQENVKEKAEPQIQIPPVFGEEEPSSEPVIPNYSVQELLRRAKDSGIDPDVVEDKEADVTLVDYSQWLKKK